MNSKSVQKIGYFQDDGQDWITGSKIPRSFQARYIYINAGIGLILRCYFQWFSKSGFLNLPDHLIVSSYDPAVDNPMMKRTDCSKFGKTLTEYMLIGQVMHLKVIGSSATMYLACVVVAAQHLLPLLLPCWTVYVVIILIP